MSLERDSKIDEYILGRMNEEDLASFQHQINNDEKLARLVKERRTLVEMVDAFGDIEVMDGIKRMHEEEMESRAKVRRLNVLKIAAGIAALLALSIWFWDSSPDNEQLFSEYYEPYKISFSERGEEGEKKILEADLLYKSGKYKKALPLFEEIIFENPDLSKAELALGLCKLEANDTEGAMNHFEKLANRDFDLYKEHGLWYAAMVKLKLNDLEASKLYLEKITKNPTSVFYNKAKEIIADL